jgi:hypothetical protein
MVWSNCKDIICFISREINHYKDNLVSGLVLQLGVLLDIFVFFFLPKVVKIDVM